MTAIEWTEKTWNPIVGCSVVSPGCTNCYAMRMAARLEAMGLAHYQGLTTPSKAGPVWTGTVALAPQRALLEPIRRRKPTTWFVNSMGDLFHDDVPDDWITLVFVVMAVASHHTFQVLTKRAARMRAWLTTPNRQGELTAAIRANALRDDRLLGPVTETILTSTGKLPWPLPNVWLGVSAEDQTRADARIPDLLATPAMIRFVSAEPLLGPLDFAASVYHDAVGVSHRGYLRDRAEWDDYRFHTPKVDWVIVGGESGPGARPMHPDWARAIRDQCQAAGVPFFFKQWGAFGHGSHRSPNTIVVFTDGRTCAWTKEACDSEDRVAGRFQERRPTVMAPTHKAKAGRMLDGREWSEMPVRRAGDTT